jgi:transcriptional regulator with XRE-family HTH domain
MDMSASNMFFEKDRKESWADKKRFNREKRIYNVTEDILVVMEQLGVNKKQLAQKLGKTKSFVTQLLSGSRNMTLGTLADIYMELGVELNISIPDFNMQSTEYFDFNVTWKNFIQSNCANDEPTKFSIKTKENSVDIAQICNWDSQVA